MSQKRDHRARQYLAQASVCVKSDLCIDCICALTVNERQGLVARLFGSCREFFAGFSFAAQVPELDICAERQTGDP